MPIKKYKPTTPSLRFRTYVQSDEISKKENSPYSPLTVGLNKKSGRNNQGRITVRRRGGGHKKLYRIIDFRRDKKDISAKVETIEYDPNRSANIALLCYQDGERRYIIAPKGLQVGKIVITSEKVELEAGNAAPIGNIPVGTNIHNIELEIGHGGQLARSAGGYATISGHDKGYTLIKLPSGEFRKIHSKCMATLGVVGNAEKELATIGKAGRSRWLGRRPKVRGVAMNPVDHPHGGGEGKSSGGRHPVTPWGKPTKGKKTRSVRKPSSRFIVSRRKNKK